MRSTKTLLVTAILSCVGSVPVQLHAQDADPPAVPDADDSAKIFASLDKDGNGTLERSEVAADRAAFFDRLVRTGDADGDGVLSLAEFAKGLQAKDAGASAPADEPVREFDTKQFFAKLDVNGDGKLALDELDEKLQVRLKPLFDGLGKTEITEAELAAIRTKAAAGQGTNDRKAFFDRLDANGDGKLELTEVPERAKQLVQALFDRQAAKTGAAVTSLTREEYVALAGPGGEAAVPVENATKVGPGLIRALDTDGDGKLSKTELAAAADKFDVLDADKDGHVDARELLGAAETTEEPAGGQTSDAEFAKRIFERYDTDKTGGITLGELNDPSAARLKENFDRVDVDKNGTISLQEFQRTITEVRGKTK